MVSNPGFHGVFCKTTIMAYRQSSEFANEGENILINIGSGKN